jgi:hypothetical protein
MSQAYSTIQDVLNVEFQEPLADLINRSNPVLRAMNKKGVASQAIYLKAQVGSDHEAGAIVDGSDVTFTDPKSTYIAPTLPWSTYLAKFSVPKRAMAQAANNPGQIGRLLMSEIEQAAKDLADKLGSDIFAGSVSNGLVGMQTMIDDGNTYAGVNRATSGNENWQSVVVDPATGGPPADTPAELSTALLYQADEEYFAANGYGFHEMPGRFTGVTDRLIMTKYRTLMENIDLSSLSTAHFVNQANGTGQLGYGQVGFMGVPFLRDRNVTAGSSDVDDSSRLYILDMNMIDLCVLNPGPDAAVHQTQGYTVAPNVDGIRPIIEIIGNKGESVQGYVKVYVQLATKDPKKAGLVIKNIKNN